MFIKKTKTVAKATAALQNTINDLLSIEQTCDVESQQLEDQILRLSGRKTELLSEASLASKVRAKLQDLLS